MHYADIYIKTGTADETVEAFARRVFQKLGIAQMAERGLPNQDPDSYFVGSAAGVEIAVGEAYKMPDYRFCVSLGLDGSSQSAEYLVEHAHVLAYRWSRDGWRCLVPKRESAFGHEHEESIYAA